VWLSNWKRLRELEEDVELLTRDVRMLKDAMEDLESRLRRLAWRVGKDSAASAAASTATGPAQQASTAADARATTYGSPGIGAPASGSAASALDPISARLLALRGRRKVAPPPAPTEEENRDATTGDAVGTEGTR
jgi:hypothetical protein